MPILTSLQQVANLVALRATVLLQFAIGFHDADIRIDDLKGSEDGSDPAYGAGLRFTLGSVEVRGEYEVFEIEDAEDAYMASLGLVWRF